MKRFMAIVLCVAVLMALIPETIFVIYADNKPTITCESKECYAGETLTVGVSISNNPGVSTLLVSPSYPKEFGAPTVTNGTLFSSITADKNIVFDANGNVTSNGVLVTLTFAIADTVAPGSYEVSIIFREASDASEGDVTFDVVPATITVKVRPVPLTGIALDKTTASVNIGSTVTLTPVFTPETATNKDVTWTTSDATVATVSGGVVTGVKTGSATITATAEDGNYQASCTVTVSCDHATTTSHSAVASTCQVQGNGDYVTCDICGDVISGSDAKLPLGVTIISKRLTRPI